MICAFNEDPFPWLELLGRSHPLVLHMPLGLVPAIALLEFGSMVFRRATPRGAILTLSWLCAVAAGVATASGLLLAGEGGYTGETVGNHKIAGIALGVLCLLSAIAACFTKRTAFRFLLLLTFVAMVPAGHLGGSITHGEDFLFEPFHDHKKARKPATEEPVNGTSGETNVGANATSGTDVDTVNVYATVIAPIFERTCSKCHNPEKQKAELLLTTPEGIMKGSEYGAVLVPGKPADSVLLTRCLLPIDDEDHMPPEGKPQPTKEELAQLEAWIQAGAKFE